MSSPIPFYVYKIVCIPTGEFYFGYRSRHVVYNRNPENDLWVRYFTSSNKIKHLITKYNASAFAASIIFRSTDLQECYWYEQDQIKCHINDPLCINYYYHDAQQGHKQFRANTRSCSYCSTEIGSGNVLKHERSCKDNPNRDPPTRIKTNCGFCGMLYGPGTLTNHERSCSANPDRVIHKRPFGQLSNCQFCNKSYKTVAMGKHEKKCPANPKFSSVTVLCLYCNELVWENQMNSAHRKFCSGAVYNQSNHSYKVRCQYCNEFMGAKGGHQQTCTKNPNRTKKLQKKVSCSHCNNLFRSGSCLIRHERSCKSNPDYIPPTKSTCTQCNKQVGKSYLPTHQGVCKSSKFTCSPV
jgi:hypothetical protein